MRRLILFLPLLALGAALPLQWTVVPPRPVSGTANVTSGLVAWYKFDDASGTSATDSSGNGWTGTLSGSTLPAWTNGVSNGALWFQGTVAYVSMNSALATNTSVLRTEFSITFWADSTFTGGGEQVVYSGVVGGADRTFLYAKPANPVMGLTIYNGSFVSKDYLGLNLTNTWTFYAFIYSNSLPAFVYTNGVLATATAHDVDTTDSSACASIGKNVGTGEAYTGSIDEFRIYNRVLTSAEITTIYNWR